MRAGLRERTTLDLRGLGPALRAHAKQCNLPVSSVARMAIAKMLETSGVALVKVCDGQFEAAAREPVKVTLRMPARIAREMATRARAIGLSHGAFVGTLIDATPMARDHREAVQALAVSTDRLATAAADLNDFARLMRRTSPSADHVDDAVATVVREVRAHLRVAARLVGDMKPTASGLRATGNGSHQSASEDTP